MFKFIIYFSFILGSYGCSQETPEVVSHSPLCQEKNISLIINGHFLNTEVACSNKDRATGLMNRTFLPSNNGMIFFFADNTIHTFWMKDTLIPLSIAFVDANWKIVDIKEMKANDETPVYPNGSSLYAIEANANWFTQNHIKVGEQLYMVKK